jgi:hypothetical protein
MMRGKLRGSAKKAKTFSTGCVSHCSDSKRDFTPQAPVNQHGKPQCLGVLSEKNASDGVFHFEVQGGVTTLKFPVDSKAVYSRMVVESGRKWS